MSASTLPDAILQTLRASAVAATVGDTYDPTTGTGTVAIGFDYLGPNAGGLPYIVIDEPSETPTYFTTTAASPKPFIASGTLNIQVWAQTRLLSITLGGMDGQVVAALKDAALTWGTSSTIKLLRPVSSQAVSIPDTGNTAPTVFLRVLTFEYMYQGAI